MLNGLDLFSGIGGISYALKDWVKPIAYCENERYAIGVLLSRMQKGDIGQAPIWNDVRTLKGSIFNGMVDIIYGGFPCQDISLAGARKGLAGERSGLFFEIARLVDEIRPSFIFLENVAAITSKGLGEVTSEITRLGYDCRWTTLSAAEVGAPHLRKRWWLLAHSLRAGFWNEPRGICGEGREDSPISIDNGDQESLAISSCKLRDRCGNVGAQGRSEDSDRSKEVCDSPSTGLYASTQAGIYSSKEGTGSWDEQSQRSDWWSTEPNVGRVANGVPSRMDRLRGLGNAVVPLQAREAFKELMGIG